MMRRCASYAKKEHTSPIFDVLLVSLECVRI
ncbi:unnamed protein product [Anisakis simplex]|uniref:Uncharacterized protein n=1 Tax=Anisakis simplex TaxID=6269 RepID=A0A0M3JLJ1_ANISI|nr:unnamed protein product [Anisakis simplex]